MTTTKVIAGQEIYDAIRAEREARLTPDACGLYDSETLCRLQESQSRRGFVEAHIVKSMYGYSVRYASGLQNFGLIRAARELGGTLAAAEQFCRDWVAADPAHRYATSVYDEELAA